ncbi:hypothetical protein IF650_17025 [Cellulosimicrobium terreum]|nr:hypothetical protein [Cellulosimicrobium terreum]
MSGRTNVLAVLSDALGAERAHQVLTRLDSYSNLPHAIKGVSGLPSDPALERAALQVFADPALGAVRGLDPAVFAEDSPQALWALLALAARADSSILDRLPAEIAEPRAAKLATIRRAVAKHDAGLRIAPASPAAPAAADGPALPEKVAQVAKWLAAHPDADPQLFAAHPKQRAAERRVGLRALGSSASPAALEVLAGYARDSYPDVELAELHRAWGRFDRRVFAATMFRPGSSVLRLDTCSTVEGIGAVQGLEGLDVLVPRDVDLAPLAECSDLRWLRVHATGESGPTSIETLVRLPALTELHLTGATRSADLTVLRESRVERLYVHLDGADGTFLTRMPQLRSLKLSGGSDPEDATYEHDEVPAPRPAHPGLVDVVLQLVADGVRVVVYRHERTWVSRLTAAVPAGVFVVERNGFVGLTRDESAVEGLGRRLFSNLVP